MRCYNCKNSNWIRANENYTCRRWNICFAENLSMYNAWSPKIKTGSKILFDNDKKYWKVIARDDRFLICIRNYRKIYYYTIVDLRDCIRGADNYKGYYDYKNCSQLELKEALYRLNMEEDKPIAELEIPEDLKEYILENVNVFGKVSNPWLEKLEISYRNFVPLNIKEVKNGR